MPSLPKSLGEFASPVGVAMGLSSEQVSSDGLNWIQDFLKDGVFLENPKPDASQAKNHQQQRRPHMPSLKCPRCDSINTKFCYYNNYSRSQPRHFCKACRRHWTEGGTLRNVPVGGGRKAKRPKTTHTSSTTSATADPTKSTASIVNNEGMTTLPQLHHLPIPFGAAIEGSIFPDVLRRVLVHPSQSLPSDYGMNVSRSNPMGSLTSPLFPPQFAGIEPVMTSSYDPFSIASSSSSLVSEDLASVNGSSALSWQAPPDLPLSTVGMGGLDTSTSSYWSCWDDDITGLVEPQAADTSPADA